MTDLFSPLALPPNVAFGLVARSLPIFESASPVIVWMLGIVVLLSSWPLAALFLRSACDLCNVPAPGFLKAMMLVLIHGVVAGAIGIGLSVGFGLLAKATGASSSLAQVLGVGLSLVVSAIIGVALYMPTLHMRIVKSLSIWGWYYFISVVVYGVALLLLIGGVTTFEGFRRLL